MSYQIHPETPPQGRPLDEYFRGVDLEPMHRTLRDRAAEFSLPFQPATLLSNSRPAILATEYARDRGAEEGFRRAVFHAYFAQGRDIGDLDVLLSLAADQGLDAETLRSHLQQGGHGDRLLRAEDQARRLGITGVPTFFVSAEDAAPDRLGHVRTIVGAHSLDVFRNVIEETLARP